MTKHFEEYNTKSLEELIQLEEQIIEEIKYLLKICENKKASPEQISEIKNSDLKFEKEKLQYIQKLIEQNQRKKTR